MLLYQFKFTRCGKTISSIERKFREDLDALDEAAKLVVEFDIHIWQGGQWIAWVKKDNAPFDQRDRYSDRVFARRDALSNAAFDAAIALPEIRALHGPTR